MGAAKLPGMLGGGAIHGAKPGRDHEGPPSPRRGYAQASEAGVCVCVWVPDVAEDGSTIPTFTTWKATGTLAAAWGVGSYPSCLGCRQWCGAARASLTEVLGRQWQLAAGPRLATSCGQSSGHMGSVGASQLRPQEPVSARPGCVRSGWLGGSPSRSGRVQSCSGANGGPTPERTTRGLLTAAAVTRHGRSHVPHRVEGWWLRWQRAGPFLQQVPRQCPGLVSRGRPGSGGPTVKLRAAEGEQLAGPEPPSSQRGERGGPPGSQATGRA